MRSFIYVLLFILSSDTCFTQRCEFVSILIGSFNLTFNGTIEGNISRSNEFCLQADGSPVTLKCENKVFKLPPSGTCVYSDLMRNLSTDLTKKLSALQYLRSDDELNRQLATLTSENKAVFRPVDVNLVSDLFCNRKISADCSVQTMSNIIEVPPDVVTDCRKSFNSTDKLLDGFDQQLQANIDDAHTIKQTNVIVKSFNIRTTNIRGIAVNGAGEPISVYRNETVDDLIRNQVILAVYFTDELLEQIERYIPTHRRAVVIVAIFLKDILFNEEAARSTHGQVMSVLIPGFKAQFKAPIRLIYRRKDVEMDSVCSHWMYGNAIHGSWHPDDESSLLNNVCSDYSMCEYWHATHFGMLVLTDVEHARTHAKALELLTVIGSGASMVGLALVFLTAIFYRKWTRKPGTLILLNFCISITLQLIVFYLASVFKWGNNSCEQCITIGAFLHYAVLTGFTWMLVLSYLNYRRYVIVLVGAPPKNIVLKSCTFAWLLPVIPVLTVSLADGESYARYSKVGLCYPSGAGFYASVLVPLIIVLITNVVVFILIARNIFSKTLSEIPRTQTFCSLGMLKVRLLVLLFFILGLTWLFGILADITKSLLLLYLFCATATLHGFIIFIFFVFMNEEVRNHFWALIRPKKRGGSPRRDTETVTGETSLNK